MHRCLDIPEIAALVCTEVKKAHGELEDSEDPDTHTLRNIALSCRSLSGPALDTLWRIQNSLDPLLQLLPLDVWADSWSSSIERYDSSERLERVRKFLNLI